MLQTVTKGTRQAYMRATMLGGYAELLEGSGFSAGDMLAQAGIPVRALSDPDMLISWHAMGRLMELTAARLAKPHLGLEWVFAVPEPFLNFGPLGLLAVFSGTLDEWCTLSRNYWQFHTNAYSVNLFESDSGQDLILRFTFDDLIPPSRHQMEYTIGGVCQFMRTLTRMDDDEFVCIRFQHLAPDDLAMHEKAFRCPVEFGCSDNELVYRRQAGLHPIEHRTDALSALLDRYVAARRATIPDFDGSTRAIVEAAIPSLIGTGCCTLGHVARLLAIGPKTLQRQLARDGTNFVEVLDRVRDRMARRFLAESDAPVARIAGLLGYGRTPPFTSAFRRWTGVSPREYRKTMRPGGDLD